MFVVFDAPSAGTIASATTSHASVEAVRATVIKGVSVNCPVSLGALAQRFLIIERVGRDGEAVASAQYAVPSCGGNDRALEFQIDVAVYPGKAVRARFSDCAAGEVQWVIINYDYQKV